MLEKIQGFCLVNCGAHISRYQIALEESEHGFEENTDNNIYNTTGTVCNHVISPDLISNKLC